jgi:hypothetical protein
VSRSLCIGSISFLAWEFNNRESAAFSLGGK